MDDSDDPMSDIEIIVAIIIAAAMIGAMTL